jgi:acyl-CoA synthetase (NDP forming)
MVNTLKNIFPPWDLPVNPLDLGVCIQFSKPEKMYREFFKAVSDNKNIDCILMHSPVIGDLNPSDEIIRLFISTREKGVPLAVWSIKMDSRLSPLATKLELHSIPVFRSSTEATRVLSAIYRYSMFVRAVG